MIMRRLEGKVAVMAGGAGGIGSACSLRLAAEGARVVVGDVRQEAAEAVVDEIERAGGQAIAQAVDLAERESISALFAAATQHYGQVDLLHCNGADTQALALDKDAIDVDFSIWEHTLRVNLTGYLHCTRAAIPLMLQQGGGAIVFTGSGAAWTPEDCRVSYSVSKAGLGGLMRHVALRWGKHNIRANIIAPGMVLTPATLRLDQELLDGLLAKTPAARHGTPEDIAAMLAMLFSSDAEWVTGQTLSVCGGMSMRQ